MTAASGFRIGSVAIVPNLGSGGGIKAAIGGAIDIAVTSRALTESESKLGLVQIEYARTPFVFAVSTKSKVTAITRGEVAEIYAGKKVTWDDGTPIRIVLRPSSDTDTTLMKDISADLRQALAVAEQRPGVRFAVTDQDAASALENIAGAIGPSSLALIISEKRPLRPLSLDGKEPAARDAASASYPHLKSLFLVTNGKLPVAAERFVSFLQSPAGRKILTGNGNLIP